MSRVFNVPLKSAIFESKKTQKRVATLVGMRDVELTRIVRGWRDATDDEKKRLARVLHKPVTEIFPEASL